MSQTQTTEATRTEPAAVVATNTAQSPEEVNKALTLEQIAHHKEKFGTWINTKYFNPLQLIS